MICKSYHHPLRIHLGIPLLHTSNNLVHKKSGCPIFISFWRSILVNMDAVLGSLVISHSGLYVLLCLLLRTWRIIPAKSWSTLWFSATDVSMYLQLYLVATFFGIFFSDDSLPCLIYFISDKKQWFLELKFLPNHFNFSDSIFERFVVHN